MRGYLPDTADRLHGKSLQSSGATRNALDMQLTQELEMREGQQYRGHEASLRERIVRLEIANIPYRTKAQ
jgi:hypothetical protein